MSISEDRQDVMMNSFCGSVKICETVTLEAIQEYSRPSSVYRPKIFKDGKCWRALYGETLQDGVVGYGASPREAMFNFDLEWSKKIK